MGTHTLHSVFVTRTNVAAAQTATINR